MGSAGRQPRWGSRAGLPLLASLSGAIAAEGVELVSRHTSERRPRYTAGAFGMTALLTLSLVTGCVSANDPDPFGLASLGPDTSTGANAEEAGAGEVASAEPTAAASQLSDDAAPAEPSEATKAVAESEQRPEAPGLIRTSIDGGAVAAYAGATVSEGGGGSNSAGESGNPSLFESLFAESEARTPVPNADRGKSRRVVLKREGAPEVQGGDALPGVDPSSLFEIGQRNSADEEILEDAISSYRVASLSGLARLAPNGLKVARSDVETSCFPRELLGLIGAVERRFATKVLVTSGYRSPSHNARVNGAKRSQHMKCTAADIVVPNADRFKVAKFVRSLPGRGGVGTYCHTEAIHVDVGPKRDWNWRCRRRG